MSSPVSIADDFLSILRAERRDLLDRLRQTRFSQLKEGYTQAQVIPNASLSPWRDDKEFAEIYARIAGATLVDEYRCFELYALARQMRSIEGEFVEVGVWRGGTAALLASAAPQKAIHLFDTFTGVAKADPTRDTLYCGGEHSADELAVRDLFAALELQGQIYPGLFPDQTATALPGKVALAHIDVDTYASAKESFETIWPLVAIGGVIIFDDYGFWGCEGVAEAVNEARSAVSNALFVHNLNGHGLMVKTR